MTIRYISTRGGAPILGFEDAVLAGLAADGGLYVPEILPEFSKTDIHRLAGLGYKELAAEILTPFTEGALKQEELTALLDEAYASFRHPAIAPLAKLGNEHYMLELFHGPTLAFKDFALQFLGPLLDHILKKRGQRATILGATSGDTGSAAIAGCQGRERLRIFILHPHNRVSDVQRRQMTTVPDKNVHNIALKGTFDDCQDIVKALFADAPFREAQQLAAVNSINWARILAQVVYYFYAALALSAPDRRLSFSVPTGNFGDIYAGYVAKRMGLPVERLIIATNRNDILTRCLNTGSYAKKEVQPTISPSMDIQVSSNFERLLFDFYSRDGAKVARLMAGFREKGEFTLEESILNRIRNDFSAEAASEEETKAAITDIHARRGLLIDPHTAVGVHAARNIEGAVVTLATAHPAKFPDAVQAATGTYPELPPHLSDLFKRKERYEVLENSADAVKRAIEEA
jgi:threonine synthase